MLENENLNLTELPLIPMRGAVIFPNAVLSFDAARKKTIEALETSLEGDGSVFIASQKDVRTEDPGLDDLYDFGTVARVKQIFRIPGDAVRVIAEGVGRGRMTGIVRKRPYIKVSVEAVWPAPGGETGIEHAALIRAAREAFENFMEFSGRFAPGMALEISVCEDAGVFSDLIGTIIGAGIAEKQKLLEETDVYKRLVSATRLLYREIGILGAQREIMEKVKTNIEKTQRDYYLREQIKVLNEELGEADPLKDEIKQYKKKIAAAKMPAHARERLESELSRLEKTHQNSPESSVIRDYMDLALDLPWHYKKRENTDLKRAVEILEKDHYGLEKVKERIIEFLAVRQNTSKLNAPIICLSGPPGVGKTSVAKSVARALNRKYVRMSLGGIHDEAEIRGHRKTYIGAMPGRIINAMRQARSMNPLILLDEIDKLSNDYKGDPASALLEALDAEQNSAFRDNYLEIPYDLSDCLFICTANTTDGILPALRDRLEIIPLSSYTRDEKIHIAMKYLIGKQLKKHGLVKSSLGISAGAVTEIIDGYAKEAGVRQLERFIGEICRKAVKERLLDSSGAKKTVTEANLKTYLGERKYLKDKRGEKPEVGVARGLAWTSLGGDTLEIEVNIMKGTGRFDLTGSMGDVMKESARAAISYIRANHEALRIRKDFYKNSDIHIHIPEGAVPKDGPSAGITMACAIVSALSGVPVKNDLGMTGEITIRGRVLPIGGVKEKTLAAKNAGLTRVILPFENEKDLNELPDYIKTDMDFVLVSDMDEVLKNALTS